MEESSMGRVASRILSRWTLLLIVTVAVIWGIHSRLDRVGVERVTVVPSTSYVVR
jgi:hypothetical protein